MILNYVCPGLMQKVIKINDKIVRLHDLMVPIRGQDMEIT